MLVSTCSGREPINGYRRRIGQELLTLGCRQGSGGGHLTWAACRDVEGVPRYAEELLEEPVRVVAVERGARGDASELRRVRTQTEPT
jgi:hypothetical protein